MSEKKRKRGRPPKRPADLQSDHIFIRVTAEEKAAITQAAGELGQAQWARSVLLRAARRALRDK